MIRFLPALLVLALMPLSALVSAATLTLVTTDGKPLEGAVVEILDESFSVYSDLPVGTMDQVDRQFKPYILVVQQGSAVDFPNSDSIKHHVYSFSKPKPFQLRLYKDVSPEPLLFDKSGVVALGCNIHDWMVGYIYVARSPHYARTDSEGRAVIEDVKGNYQFKVWHPRIQEADLARRENAEFGATEVRFVLQQPLHAELLEEEDEFGGY